MVESQGDQEWCSGLPLAYFVAPLKNRQRLLAPSLELDRGMWLERLGKYPCRDTLTLVFPPPSHDNYAFVQVVFVEGVWKDWIWSVTPRWVMPTRYLLLSYTSCVGGLNSTVCAHASDMERE